MYMGLVPFPNMRWYWMSSFFMHSAQFSSSMSRNRFLAISRYFHTFNRKAILKSNKDKLRMDKPILDYVQRRCRTVLVPEKHLSLDEGTLPYKRRLSIKVFNPNKPHKYGLKFFFLCESSTGYVIDFITYSGLTTTLQDTVFSPLQQFVHQGYHVFMGNYYKSVALAQELYDNGIHVRGTLRLARGAPLDMRSLSKLPMWDFPQGLSVFHRKRDVFVICWMGIRLVPMITNSSDTTSQPYIMKRRGNRGGRTVCEEVPIECLTVIGHYTRYMGGVDLFRQMVNYYSFARQTMRWYKIRTACTSGTPLTRKRRPFWSTKTSLTRHLSSSTGGSGSHVGMICNKQMTSQLKNVLISSLILLILLEVWAALLHQHLPHRLMTRTILFLPRFRLLLHIQVLLQHLPPLLPLQKLPGLLRLKRHAREFWTPQVTSNLAITLWSSW